MTEPKEEPKVAERLELTKEELTLISNVLFQSRFNGQEWETIIKPLINKIAKIIEIDTTKVLGAG